MASLNVKKCFTLLCAWFTVVILILSSYVYACALYGPNTYYTSCNEEAVCGYRDDCGSGAVSAYDWGTTLFDECAVGCAAGQYYDPDCLQGGSYLTCVCGSKEAKWKPTSQCKNGNICKLRWGAVCDWSFEGVWDKSEGKCIKCSGKKQVKKAIDCWNYDETIKCESACGAPNKCDEVTPKTGWCEGSVANLCYGDCSYSSRDCSKDLCDNPDVLWVNGKCIADDWFIPGFSCVDCKTEKGCVYYGVWCDSDSKCDEKPCGGSKYICDGNNWVKMKANDDDSRLQCECHGHYWDGSGTSVTYLSGNKGSAPCCGDEIERREKWVSGAGICCYGVWKSGSGYECCTNADCPSDRPYCVNNKCVQCRNDDDCSGYDPNTHTKLVCECPSGCTLTGSSYTCKPKPTCSATSECADNYCCYTSEMGGDGSCKSRGTIINYDGKSYLCDPPYGFVTSENEINPITEEQEVETTNLIDIIFEIFSKVFS